MSELRMMCHERRRATIKLRRQWRRGESHLPLRQETGSGSTIDPTTDRTAQATRSSSAGPGDAAAARLQPPWTHGWHFNGLAAYKAQGAVRRVRHRRLTVEESWNCAAPCVVTLTNASRVRAQYEPDIIAPVPAHCISPQACGESIGRYPAPSAERVSAASRVSEGAGSCLSTIRKLRHGDSVFCILARPGNCDAVRLNAGRCRRDMRSK